MMHTQWLSEESPSPIGVIITWKGLLLAPNELKRIDLLLLSSITELKAGSQAHKQAEEHSQAAFAGGPFAGGPFAAAEGAFAVVVAAEFRNNTKQHKGMAV